MQLPGRLRSTSLGDLLGSVHRAGATGTLEFVEDGGRTHRVHVTAGLIAAVELDGASPSLGEILRSDGRADTDILRRSLLRAIASQRLHGEVLIDDFSVSAEVVGRALRRQAVLRLAVLERLPDARVAFRVALRPPRGALTGRHTPAPGPQGWDAPLGPQEFLRGRRRARERSAALPAPSARVATAWDVLGLPSDAPIDHIKRAYRRLARAVHPDLHPHAGDNERRLLQARFVVLTDAYRTLIAEV
jgi:hypothetical protein